MSKQLWSHELESYNMESMQQQVSIVIYVSFISGFYFRQWQYIYRRKGTCFKESDSIAENEIETENIDENNSEVIVSRCSGTI